jgi:hypothetical protein
MRGVVHPVTKLGKHFVGAMETTTNTGTGPLLRNITGAQSGDVVIATVYVNGVQTIDALPAGWTFLLDTFVNASTVHASSYWKIMDDTLLGEQWTLSGSVSWSVHASAYRGIDQVTPIVDAATENENPATSTTWTFPAITTTVKSILHCVAFASGTRYIARFAQPFTRSDLTRPGVPYSRLVAAYTPVLPPGTYGTYDNAIIGSTTTYGAQTIALAVKG